MGIFRGGVPTDVDVANLFKRFGTPAENTLIGYDEIAEIVKAPAGSHRFRSVLARWRRQLAALPHNVYLRAQPDAHAYRVMDPSLRLDRGRQHARSARRHQRRGFLILGTTDTARLSPEEQHEHTHLQHRFATALQAERSLSKRPAPQLPESNVSR